MKNECGILFKWVWAAEKFNIDALLGRSGLEHGKNLGDKLVSGILEFLYINIYKGDFIHKYYKGDGYQCRGCDI